MLWLACSAYGASPLGGRFVDLSVGSLLICGDLSLPDGICGDLSLPDGIAQGTEVPNLPSDLPAGISQDLTEVTKPFAKRERVQAALWLKNLKALQTIRRILGQASAFDSPLDSLSQHLSQLHRRPLVFRL